MALVKITCMSVREYTDVTSNVTEWITTVTEVEELMGVTLASDEYISQTLTVEDSI